MWLIGPAAEGWVPINWSASAPDAWKASPAISQQARASALKREGVWCFKECFPVLMARVTRCAGW